MDAQENEAIYIRWVNLRIHYATYESIREMTGSLQEIIRLVQQGALNSPQQKDQ